MRKTTLILSLLLISLNWTACEKDTANEENNNSSASDGISHEEDSDYLWESSSEIPIIFSGNSVESSSAQVLVNGTTATILKGGNYTVSGTLSNGQLIVDAPDEVVRLILSDASITNSSGPAILAENADKLIIYLVPGTVNEMTESASTSSELNAAVFSKSDMTIFGEGSLNITGAYKDGISSKDGLVIKSGVFGVSASDDGIRGKDYLIVHGGSFTISSGGDGFIADNDAGTATGYIQMDNGTFGITSGGDGISAFSNVLISGGDFTIRSGNGTINGDASAKGIKGLSSVTLSVGSCFIQASDDAIHSDGSVVIKSGNYTISTADDGIHADESILIEDGTITVTSAYEGFESHSIAINQGNIRITATDDCLNATAGNRTEQNDGSYDRIYGGRIVLNSSTGDPLDSNGSIEMTGGTVIIHGPSSQPEVAIDYNGSFNISGGFIVASGSGSNMTQAPSSSSSQKSLKLMFKSSNPASTLFHLKDSEGNEVVTFQPARKYQSIIFSSPALLTGKTYSIYKSGTSTGTQADGLYEDGSYSPGSLVSSFTISSAVTTLTNL